MTGVIALGVIALALPSLVPPVPDPAAPVRSRCSSPASSVYAWSAGAPCARSCSHGGAPTFSWSSGSPGSQRRCTALDRWTYTQLGWWLGHGFEVPGSCSSAPPSRSTSSAPTRRARSPATCVAPSSSSQEEAFLGSHVRALTAAWSRRIRRPRSTRDASRCSPCSGRGARAAARPGCARSRSAGCCTTSASSPCRTRSSEARRARRRRVRRRSAPSGLGRRAAARPRLRRRDRARPVLDHHERLDGSGYPRALAAEAARPRHPRPRGLRRLRRSRLAPRLPRRVVPRACPRRCSATRPGLGSTPAASPRWTACSRATSRTRPLQPDRRFYPSAPGKAAEGEQPDQGDDEPDPEAPDQTSVRRR